jgi:hypothetical protein
MYRQNAGYYSRSVAGRRSRYGSQFGSEHELIDATENESDSVFTDDDVDDFRSALSFTAGSRPPFHQNRPSQNSYCHDRVSFLYLFGVVRRLCVRFKMGMMLTRP